MKKIIIYLLFSFISMVAISQIKPLQYQSMYIPKSSQQIWNEVVMANTIVDDAILKAKYNYKNDQYVRSIANCKEALKYSKKYLSKINTETYYILGKNYGKIGKKGKAKKYLKKARKYGIYMDSQVF